MAITGEINHTMNILSLWSLFCSPPFKFLIGESWDTTHYRYVLRTWNPVVSAMKIHINELFL